MTATSNASSCLALNTDTTLRERSALGLRYHLQLPRGAADGTGLLVAVHGVSRDATEQLKLWAPHAQRLGLALLAPRFSRGAQRGYQRLQAARGRPGADRLLLALLEELHEQHGIAVERVHLFGYSGGGQFAHRFALLHPERVASLTLGAPGWFTFPHPGYAYPLGLAPGAAGLPRAFRLQEFLRLPIRVLVGAQDTARDPALNTRPEIDALQGSNRLERARHWVAAVNRAATAAGQAAPAQLIVLPGVGHAFAAAMAHPVTADFFPARGP